MSLGASSPKRGFGGTDKGQGRCARGTSVRARRQYRARPTDSHRQTGEPIPSILTGPADQSNCDTDLSHSRFVSDRAEQKQAQDRHHG